MTSWYWLRLPGEVLPREWELENRLCAAQRERLERLRNEDARRHSLYAHLLVRVVLCEAFGLDNRTLRLQPDAHGKPQVMEVTGMHVSLAHTQGAVTAVAAEAPVGVDIERLREMRVDMAKRFFTPAEARYILEGPDGGHRRLLEVWVGKEACVKCMGQSLAANLTALDTRAPKWQERMAFVEREGYLLACCGQMPFEALRRVEVKQLLERAEALAICER